MYSIMHHNRRSRTSITVFTVLALLGAYLLLHLFTSSLGPIRPVFTWSPWTPKTQLPPASYHNYTSAFAFDLDLATNPAWMARIPDAAPLSSLSIPGTHDTLTHDLVTNVVFQCQNHDLATQLRAGLRYFDIRGRLLYNATASADQQGPPVIGIYHGHVATGYDFTDVLQTVFAFLDAHPSEGVILRVKEEGAPLPVDGSSSSDSGDEDGHWVSGTYNTTFEEAFNYYRHTNALTAPGCARHFLTPWPRPPAQKKDAADSPLRLVPTMGEMRGRVLVLYEFVTAAAPRPPAAAADYGIPWTSPHIALEDLWIILAPELLAQKWDAVRRNLEAAGASAAGADVLFLSHLSASVGVTPIEAAAGPWPERTNGSVVEGLNERTGRWLEDGGGGEGVAGKIGVVMIDFPGQRLVGEILRRNRWLMEDEYGG